jgi:phosphonoacetate hydrolase
MNRRHLLLAAPALLAKHSQRVFIFLIDGLGEDYIASSHMPVMTAWGKKGIRKTVQGVMPSVTNANNASLCCSCFPEQHGVTANFFLDEATGNERYMESPDLVLRPTIFERLTRKGVKSALLSSKKKTTSLLLRGANLTLSAEVPAQEWTERLGPAPHIYSPEINYWLLKAAIWIAKHRSDIGLIYIHTTDYPMHMWPPEAAESKHHLSSLDALFGELAHIASDAAILLTADHGMNHKSRCWDLEKACAARGTTLRAAISAEQDKYLKHHRGFGSTAWVYLRSAKETDRAAEIISSLAGVEQVLTRHEAARRFRTMPSRIGHLVVLGDRGTVFGGLDTESQELPSEYRSHGGLSEAKVPLVVFNAGTAPGADYFRYNLDLARWLS